MLVGDLSIELGQRLVHDLANAFAADPNLLGDLLECQRLAAIEPEAQPENLCLALIDGVHQIAEDAQLVGVEHRITGLANASVGDHLAHADQIAVDVCGGLLVGRAECLDGPLDDLELLDG